MFFVYILSLVLIWLVFFIFSKKRIKKIWLILLGISSLIMVYALHPNIRIYSVHGFVHTGIVYQLLNGNIPPYNPFLGGHVIYYPWGWHCVAALITKILNITPFYAFAIINIVSLFLAMVLVYKISGLLIEDEKANIFSVIISIFAITIMDRHVNSHLERLLHIKIPIDYRVIPVFDKFSHVNGLPIGLVFFLLFVYSIIKLFQNKNVTFSAIASLISILSCGFFYPLMLPGIVASTVFICLASIMYHNNGCFTHDLKKITLLVSVMFVAILSLTPYLLILISAIRTNVQFFNLEIMRVNAIKYFVITVPILVIIWIEKNFLKHKLNKQALVILLSVILANLSCFIFIRLPLESQYKYCILSTVTLGIVGGIAFSNMNRGFKKLLVFILLLLFIAPLYRKIQFKLSFRKNAPDASALYFEKGRYIYCKNSEENELYQWIREHTEKNAIFIDSELTIPVFAQRQLFIGMDRKETRRGLMRGMSDIWGVEPGYGYRIDTFLRLINGYDPDLLNRRQALVKSIYDTKKNLNDEKMKEFFDSHKNIYFVVRTKKIKHKFNQAKFKQVFRSSKGHILIYQKGS